MHQTEEENTVNHKTKHIQVQLVTSRSLLELDDAAYHNNIFKALRDTTLKNYVDKQQFFVVVVVLQILPTFSILNE